LSKLTQKDKDAYKFLIKFIGIIFNKCKNNIKKISTLYHY